MTDYSNLPGIEVFFKPHATPKLHRVTQQLDGHYSDIVPLDKLKPLFKDQDPTKGLAIPDPLKDTIADLLMIILQTELIEPRATDTADVSSITVAMNRAKPMIKLPEGRDVRLTRARLIQLLDAAIADKTNAKLATIYLDVDTWYYPEDAPPEIKDFALISEWKGKKDALAQLQASNTPSPLPTYHSSPSAAAPSTGSPNTVVNTTMMTLECRVRYDRNINESGFTLKEYLEEPFMLPDGTKRWYCLIGPWQFVTIDGSVFTKPQEIDRKGLRDTISPLSSDKPHEVRRWLQDTGQTMLNAQFFWLPFWARRPGRGARGFTCGDTEDNDILLWMAGYIQTMGTLLYQWLIRKGTLPENSPLTDMVKLARGDGYVALNLIMQTVHPLELCNPVSMIPSFPKQGQDESFAQYYHRVINYLQLCAIILNVDVSFDDYSQQDFLILNSLHPEFLLQEAAKFREDNRYKNLFNG